MQSKVSRIKRTTFFAAVEFMRLTRKASMLKIVRVKYGSNSSCDPKHHVKGESLQPRD